MRLLRHALMIVLGTLVVAAAPASGGGPALAMLDGLDRGSWELRVRGDEARVERICLENGRRLIQLRHPQLRCGNVVLDDNATEVTVQYTCPGQGYGRTHIRRETSSLVQIDSQGIAGGYPFAFAAEARRIGDCRG